VTSSAVSGRAAVPRAILLLGLVAGVIWIGSSPTTEFRRVAVSAFGVEAYRGWGIAAAHLFSGLLQALAAITAWGLAIRWGSGIEPPRMAASRTAAQWGVVGALPPIAVTLVTIGATQGWSALHAPVFDPWLLSANLYSNFFEELIFRGFLLAALTVVAGFWPAAIVSSLLFGLVHTQYPVPLRLIVASFGVLWCWVARRSGGLFAPWLAHMLLDWTVDPLVS
jgi:membrane protease YdiL (CAAX protease family)